MVSVAYRQAPEYKFPTAHNDSYAAYEWTLKNAASIKGDPKNVAVAGESAGGNLAAAVSMMARDKGAQLPVHQLLVYPIATYDFTTPSYQKHAKAKPLDKAMMQWFFGKYLRSPEETAAFYDVYGPENKKLKVLTFTVALPIMIEEVTESVAREILQRHFLNEKEFKLTYPIPSVAKSEPSFDPYESKFLWRGPTWTVVNWFLYRCFEANGFEKDAKFLLKSVKDLISKSGFREYYHPLSGKGYGAKDFTWSGLVVDMMEPR